MPIAFKSILDNSWFNPFHRQAITLREEAGINLGLHIGTNFLAKTNGMNTGAKVAAFAIDLFTAIPCNVLALLFNILTLAPIRNRFIQISNDALKRQDEAARGFWKLTSYKALAIDAALLASIAVVGFVGYRHFFPAGTTPNPSVVPPSSDANLTSRTAVDPIPPKSWEKITIPIVGVAALLALRPGFDKCREKFRERREMTLLRQVLATAHLELMGKYESFPAGKAAIEYAIGELLKHSECWVRRPSDGRGTILETNPQIYSLSILRTSFLKTLDSIVAQCGQFSPAFTAAANNLMRISYAISCLTLEDARAIQAKYQKPETRSRSVVQILTSQEFWHYRLYFFCPVAYYHIKTSLCPPARHEEYDAQFYASAGTCQEPQTWRLLFNDFCDRRVVLAPDNQITDERFVRWTPKDTREQKFSYDPGSMPT